MNKALILKKVSEYQHVFKLLPISDGIPKDKGTWGAYPFDNSMQFWIDSSHPEAISFYKYIVKQQEIHDMEKALTVVEEGNIQTLLKNNMKAIQSVLPNHLTPEKAARLLYGLLVGNPALGRCTQSSIMNCFLEASTLGLEIGGALHHASLIPYKKQATLIIEYNGKIMLANNTGNVKNVSAHAVYEKDKFEYRLGLNPDIIHIPSDEFDPGPLKNAYAVINYLNGGQDFEVITKKIAMEAKQRSAAKNSDSSPWNQKDMEYQQWKKTAVHRLMNRVPKSAEKLGQVPMDGYVPNRLEGFDILEMEPVRIPEKPAEKKPAKQTKKPVEKQQPKDDPKNYPDHVKKLMAIKEIQPAQFDLAWKELKLTCAYSGISKTDAVKLSNRISELVDSENQ